MENQLEMMNKMGPIQQIMKLIPGLGNQLPANASKVTEEKLGMYKILMNSMTTYELENPEVIKNQE